MAESGRAGWNSHLNTASWETLWHWNSVTPCSLKNGGDSTSRLSLIRSKWGGVCRGWHESSVKRPLLWALGYLLCPFGSLYSANFWNVSTCSLDQFKERASEWFTWEAKLPLWRNGVSHCLSFLFYKSTPCLLWNCDGLAPDSLHGDSCVAS